MKPPETLRERVPKRPARESQPAHSKVTFTGAEHRAGSTRAGPATGPGQLGRRLVPETVRADPATSSVVPTAPQGAPTTTPARNRTSPAAGDAVNTRRPLSGSARGSRDVESLQRSLAAAGRLSNPHQGGDGERRTSTSRTAPQGGGGPVGRPAPGSRPVSSAAPARQRPRRPPDNVSSRPPDNVPSRPPERLRLASPHPRGAPVENGRPAGGGAGSAQQAHPGGAAGRSTSATVTADPADEPSRTPAHDTPSAASGRTVPVLQGLDRTADPLTTTSDRPIARSVTAADTVRLRRLIPTTGVGPTDFSPDVDLAVRPAGVIVEHAAPGRADETPVAPPPQAPRPTTVAGIAAGIAAVAVTGERSHDAERVRPRPSTNLTPDNVLRRVALPRTMSRRNRPVSTLTEAVMRSRRQASIATRHARVGTALADGGPMSPITSANVAPPAARSAPSSDRPAVAQRGVLQRGLASVSESSVEQAAAGPGGSDHAATAPPLVPRPPAFTPSSSPTPTSSPSVSSPSTSSPSTSRRSYPRRAHPRRRRSLPSQPIDVEPVDDRRHRVEPIVDVDVVTRPSARRRRAHPRSADPRPNR